MAGTGVLILELVLYVSCFVCGIVTAASITITQGRFAGLCVLYGLVSYNKTSESIDVVYSSSPSVCHFVSTIAVLMSVVCFSLSLHCLYSFCIDGNMKRERLWTTLTACVCAGFLFFLLVAGCILRNGSITLCSSITQAVPNITSCDEAQLKAWTSPLKGDRFYSNLHKSETTVWVSLILWLLIGALGFAQRRFTLTFPGGFEFSAGRILADPGVTAAETEPFFNCPAQRQ